MTIGDCIKKIDRFLAKSNVQPLIVDVQNSTDLTALVTHYNVGNNIFIAASSCGNEDDFPRLDTILDTLAKRAGRVFLTELSTFLKLQGELDLRKMFNEILSMNSVGNVIVFTYQCKQYLNFVDPRLTQRICIVDGDPTPIPMIVFATNDSLLPYNSQTVYGLKNIANAIESGMAAERLYVITAKTTNMYPQTLFFVANLSKAYDALLEKDSSTAKLREDSGIDSQWAYVLEKFQYNSSWTDIIDDEFGSHNSLDLVIPNLPTFDDKRRWIFFEGLKLFGAKNNWCLNEASMRAMDLADLTRQIYRCLLDVDHLDPHFTERYQQRKTLLMQLKNPSEEVSDYCRIVRAKEKDAIYYLTDNTQKEKELIFTLLDQYANEYTRDEVMTALRLVYPALYDYLSPYRFKNDLLDTYFQDYKYQKVVNRVFPEFEEIVTEQAERRDYNLILEPRTAKFDSIDRTDTQLYFVDAMGAEYLSYILSVCKEMHLMANVSVCSCELPSITSRNKEFLDLFEGSIFPPVSIKDIDEIKHHGKDDFDYQKTKLPIHLAKELDILHELLGKVRDKLESGQVSKVILAADHGASRLAVIHETECILEMSTSGVHSGRCCLKSDVDEKPLYATDAGDFWALANYDRFKGSRKANVEVHGGATIEEVTVPIIELTYLPSNIEVHLMPVDGASTLVTGTPEILVSYRRKAAIKVFATSKLVNVSLCIDGRYYDAVSQDGNISLFEMPDIKKAKTYYVDVLSCGNVIAEKLPLIVKKEGSGEKNLL